MGIHSQDIVIRVLLALLLGGVIGLERELTDHPAGIRTHILVTVGACIFTTLSLFGFPGFPGGDRVAAAVVTGIGFIGGGAILRTKTGIVTGLTTAASLWTCAALGMLVGCGFFKVGLIVTVIDLFVLRLLDWVVDRASPKLKSRLIPVAIRGDYSPGFDERATKALSELGCCPQLLRYNRGEGGGRVDLSMLAKVSGRSRLPDLTARLLEVEGVTDVSWG